MKFLIQEKLHFVKTCSKHLRGNQDKGFMVHFVHKMSLRRSNFCQTYFFRSIDRLDCFKKLFCLFNFFFLSSNEISRNKFQNIIPFFGGGGLQVQRYLRQHTGNKSEYQFYAQAPLLNLIFIGSAFKVILLSMYFKYLRL